MAGKPTDDIVRCSFCNKTQAQVRKLIAGPNGTYICDECIGICSEIIEEELDYNERELFDDINLLTPEEMKAFLDDYVIGQDEAKKYFQWQFITITKNYGRTGSRGRAAKKQYFNAWSDRLRENASGPDTCESAERAFCDCGCDGAYRGRICGRRCGKYPFEDYSGGRWGY